jgi:hypothetical protein
MEMASRQTQDAVDQTLEEVSRLLESGKLDISGRYYSEEELAARAALGGKPLPAKPEKASAA